MPKLISLRQRLAWSSMPALLTFVAITLLSAVARAQTYDMPVAVQEMAFMRAGAYLYIQGGKVVNYNQNLQTFSQLFSLDLSTSWSVRAPPWKKLADGPGVFLHNGVATPDNQTLIVFYQTENEFVSTKYDIQQDKWQTPALKPTLEDLQGSRTVNDPQTDTVFFNGAQNVLVYTINSNDLHSNQYQAGALTSRKFSGAVYNTARKTIMYLGGYSSSFLYEKTTYITEYDIATQAWTVFPTTGALPSTRADHCMAASEDGYTIVVFGGRTPPDNYDYSPTANHTGTLGNYTGTLHVLDVRSRTWTQQPSSDKRLYMACTVVGDQFLAWGGSDGTSTVDGPPIIFDLTNRQWVENYTPPAYLVGGAIRPQVPAIVTGSSSSNMGAILGGTLGTLFVITLATLLYFYMRRRSRRVQYERQSTECSQSEKADKDKDLVMSCLPYMHINNSQVRSPHTLVDDARAGRNPQDAEAMGLSFWNHYPDAQSPHLNYSRMGDDSQIRVYPACLQSTSTPPLFAQTMASTSSFFAPAPAPTPTYSQRQFAQSTQGAAFPTYYTPYSSNT